MTIPNSNRENQTSIGDFITVMVIDISLDLYIWLETLQQEQKVHRYCLVSLHITKIDVRLYFAIFENGLPKSPPRL